MRRKEGRIVNENKGVKYETWEIGKFLTTIDKLRELRKYWDFNGEIKATWVDVESAANTSGIFTPRQLQLLTLKYTVGYKRTKVAELLGITKGAVTKGLDAALQRFCDYLNGEKLRSVRKHDPYTVAHPVLSEWLTAVIEGDCLPLNMPREVAERVFYYPNAEPYKETQEKAYSVEEYPFQTPRRQRRIAEEKEFPKEEIYPKREVLGFKRVTTEIEIDRNDFEGSQWLVYGEKERPKQKKKKYNLKDEQHNKPRKKIFGF